MLPPVAISLCNLSHLASATTRVAAQAGSRQIMRGGSPSTPGTGYRGFLNHDNFEQENKSFGVGWSTHKHTA